MRPPENVTDIAPVKYYWREWYVRVLERGGRIIHYGPWLTEWAARKCAEVLLARFRYERRLDGQEQLRPRDGQGPTPT